MTQDSHQYVPGLDSTSTPRLVQVPDRAPDSVMLSLTVVSHNPAALDRAHDTMGFAGRELYRHGIDHSLSRTTVSELAAGPDLDGLAGELAARFTPHELVQLCEDMAQLREATLDQDTGPWAELHHAVQQAAIATAAPAELAGHRCGPAVQPGAQP